jgi:hypothetical protein
MNTSKKLFVLFFVSMVFSIGLRAEDVTITVKNEEKTQRQELIEVDANVVFTKMGIKADDDIIVKNALNQQVAYQLTHDGKLLIEASVRPCGSACFTITQGKPKPMKVFVCGRQYPERVDDVAWENDRTAYRVYGPALQQSGEKAYGIDVWVKNTPDLEVEKRYRTELSNHSKILELRKENKNDEAADLEEATTYHFDHGYGLDCYKVGPTLGCGAPALMENGKLLMPYCYKTYEILDNGPLRFTVKLIYNPIKVNDKEVIENRIISLDKGSNFNKMTIWYEGLTKPCDLAAGVVIHSEDTTSVVLGNDYVQYADPTDNPSKQNFQIYVATLFPQGVNVTKKLMFDNPTNGNAGHAVGILTYKPNEKYTYYFGSAWSKNDVRSQAEWQLRIDEFLDALHNPLEIEVK